MPRGRQASRSSSVALLALLPLLLQPAVCQLLGTSSGGSATLGVVLPPRACCPVPAHLHEQWQCLTHLRCMPAAASCVTKGQKLRNGDCSQFVDYFVGNQQCSANDADFKKVVQSSPSPDAQ